MLLRSSLKLGVKAATVGALGAADLEDIAADFAAEASNLVDKHLGELLTKHKQQKDAIQGFRDALSELPALLSDEPGEVDESVGEVSEPRPLIFIIDELDRCRPTFALEILERIKHFFSVPNVHFILGVHLEQLRNSVIVAYGSNIDAQTYLQKFIHLTFFLADRARFKQDRTTRKFMAHLEKVMEFKREDADVVDRTTEVFLHVAEHRDLSLRAIERVMSTFAIALAFAPSNFIKPGPIMGGLCLFKVLAPPLYLKAKQGRITYEEVNNALGLEDSLSEDERLSDWYVSWWRYCTDPKFEQKDIEEFNRGLSRARFNDRFEIVPAIANDVIDRLVTA